MSDHVAIDGWTSLHVLTGVGLALFNVPRAVAYLIIAGTEIIEAGFRSIGITFFRETQQNIIVDIIASVVGFEFTKAVT